MKTKLLSLTITGLMLAGVSISFAEHITWYGSNGTGATAGQQTGSNIAYGAGLVGDYMQKSRIEENLRRLYYLSLLSQKSGGEDFAELSEQFNLRSSQRVYQTKILNWDDARWCGTFISTIRERAKDGKVFAPEYAPKSRIQPHEWCMPEKSRGAYTKKLAERKISSRKPEKKEPESANSVKPQEPAL